MFFPRSIVLTRVIVARIAAVFVIVALSDLVHGQQSLPTAPSQATSAAPAPQYVHLKDYSQPQSSFPHVLRPYTSQELAQVNLANSPRIDSLMHDGKIYLSIDDAVALSLENNLDLEIARYNLNIAEADLLRAKSGASILGVNTGVVQ